MYIMFCCILPFQEFPAHKHPKGKSESYTVIDGKLYVEKYDENSENNGEHRDEQHYSEPWEVGHFKETHFGSAQR